jgi:hypothetical protein
MGNERVDESARKRLATSLDIEEKHLQVHKRLLPPSAWDAIESARHKVRRYHKRMTVMWDKGVALLPSAKFMEYNQTMRKLVDEYNRATNSLADRLDDYKSAQRVAQRALFREVDWPTAAYFRTRFSINLTYMPVPNAGDFRVDVFGDQLETVRANLEDMVTTRIADSTLRCRMRLLKDLTELYETLNDPKTVLRSSLLDNLKFSAEIIPLLNVLDDPTLNKQAQRALAIVKDYTADAIRHDEEVRATCAREARELIKELTPDENDQG